MNNLFRIFRYVKKYPRIWKCKYDAVKFKEEKIYEHVLGINGLINDIIKNPEKYYEEYTIYDDMHDYIDYINCRDQSVS